MHCPWTKALATLVSLLFQVQGIDWSEQLDHFESFSGDAEVTKAEWEVPWCNQTWNIVSSCLCYRACVVHFGQSPNLTTASLINQTKQGYMVNYCCCGL